MSIYGKLPAEIRDLVGKPATETGLDGYSFTLISQTETSRGICWVATIKFKNKKVIQVENRGDGGCNHYHYENASERTKFTKLAKRVYPYGAEPIDSLVGLLDVASAF